MTDARQLAAALVSPWPTWQVEAPDEAGLLERLAIAGPCPQADLFEPWEAGDPWRARVLHPPGATEALIAAGRLEAGVAPGLLEWVDRDRVGDERIDADGLSASCLYDLEDGGLLLPDLVHEPVDPAVASAVLAALGSLGADRVGGARHRSTGRPGVLVEVAAPDRDPVAERRAVIEALAHVARDIPLAPDARWWFDAGRIVALGWRIAPCGPSLPLEGSVDGSVWRGPGRAELHVALPPSEHDALAATLGERLGALGWVGARPRWGHRGGAPVFLACWEGSEDAIDGARGGVEGLPHRIVPGCPPGLEPDWLGVDPAWWVSGARALVRWRCGLRDRDLLPVCGPRVGDDVDRAIAHELAPLGACEPVDAGGPALRLDLPALPAASWRVVVDLLGALPEPAIGSVIPVAMRDRTTLILPRADLPVRDEPPTYTSLAL